MTPPPQTASSTPAKWGREGCRRAVPARQPTRAGCRVRGRRRNRASSRRPTPCRRRGSRPPRPTPSPGLLPSAPSAPARTRPGIVQARGPDRRPPCGRLGLRRRALRDAGRGRPGFLADTVSDTIARVLTTEPNWSLLPPGTPTALSRLLHRALEKDPRHRLRHIGDALLDLMEVEGQAKDVIDATGAASLDAVQPRRRSVKRFVLPISGDGVRSSERGATSAGSEAVVLALAPDGSALCYSADGVLHIRLFEQTEARPIPARRAANHRGHAPHRANPSVEVTGIRSPGQTHSCQRIGTFPRERPGARDRPSPDAGS